MTVARESVMVIVMIAELVIMVMVMYGASWCLRTKSGGRDKNIEGKGKMIVTIVRVKVMGELEWW